MRLQSLQYRPRIVAGSVFDDDHLIPRRGAVEGRSSQLHEQRQILRFVLGRDEYTDVDRVVRGNGNAARR